MNWKVRFVDYPLQFSKMEQEIMGTLKEVLSRGDLILRQQLRDFETNLAAFVGTKYAVGVSNCTDGLRLALEAAGVGQGDEVITVSHTFVATVAAIHHCGASPVLVDIGDDHNMDMDLVEKAITPRTKALLPVHLNGRLCSMDRLMALAERHHLVVIEDSAQALGAAFNSKRGGAFGMAGCFSFYPAKLLGAFGDAGAVVTNSESMAARVRSLRDHGRTSDGNIAGWSFNCRMDNLQAAILDLKLKRVPSWITRRREIAQLYHRLLRGVEQICLPPAPKVDGPFFDVYQNFEMEAENRDGLVRHLKDLGIETLLPWGGRAVHEFEALRLANFLLPRTERLLRSALLLPLTTELSDEQVEYVAKAVRDFYREDLQTLGSSRAEPLQAKEERV